MGILEVRLVGWPCLCFESGHNGRMQRNSFAFTYFFPFAPFFTNGVVEGM